MSSCLMNCSNQGICKLDPKTQKFICECNTNFMGKSCQTDKRPCMRWNPCLNNATCLNLNSTSFQCKCNNGFSGEICDLESNTIKQLKTFQWTSTIICIICLIIFWTLIVGSDVLDYLRIGHEHIDMNEWRREKYYGKSEKAEPKKSIPCKKGEIIHFEYVNW